MTMQAARTGAIDRRTLADTVREELERRILDGELSAGEKLNEVALATALGVSRGTVREAIRTLSQSGLIDLVANRGAWVKKVSAEDVACLYELRRALFGLGCENAARSVAQGRAGDLVARLDANIEAMRHAAQARDSAVYYALNIEFHATLMDAAGNPHAEAAYRGCVRKAHLFRRRGLSRPANLTRSIGEHGEILDAVRAGDADRAAESARRHVEGGLKRFMATVTMPES